MSLLDAGEVFLLSTQPGVSILQNYYGALWGGVGCWKKLKLRPAGQKIKKGRKMAVISNLGEGEDRNAQFIALYPTTRGLVNETEI